MRFAYADPPYLGQGASRYGHLHPDAAVWDDPATHVGLVDRLEAEYPDGWAASLLATAPSVACYLRPHLRLAAWVRPGEVTTRVPNLRHMWTWELVIYRTSVPNSIRFGPRVRDSLVALGVHSQKVGTHTGRKPPEFCRWVLDLLGYDPARDELDDLFPGEGGMTEAASQQRLEMDGPTWPTWSRRRRDRIRASMKTDATLPLDGARIDGSEA